MGEGVAQFERVGHPQDHFCEAGLRADACGRRREGMHLMAARVQGRLLSLCCGGGSKPSAPPSAADAWVRKGRARSSDSTHACTCSSEAVGSTLTSSTGAATTGSGFLGGMLLLWQRRCCVRGRCAEEEDCAAGSVGNVCLLVQYGAAEGGTAGGFAACTCSTCKHDDGRPLQPLQTQQSCGRGRRRRCN